MPEQYVCGECEEAQATLYCEECKEYYCADCDPKVHAKGRRKLHRRVPYDSSTGEQGTPQAAGSPAVNGGENAGPGFCQEHQQKNTLFCTACKEIVCPRCLLSGRHARCPCKSLDVALLETQGRIREKVDLLSRNRNLLENHLENLRDLKAKVVGTSERARDDVSGKINELRERLATRMNELQKIIAEVERKETSSISSQEQELQRKAEVLGAQLLAAQDALDVNDPIAFFGGDGDVLEIEASVDRLNADQYSTTLAQHSTAHFDQTIELVSQQMRSFATIKGTTEDGHRAHESPSTHTPKKRGALLPSHHAAPPVEVVDEVSDKRGGGFQCSYSISGHQDYVVALAMTEDELFSASRDGSVKVWDLQTCEMFSLFTDKAGVNDIAIDEGDLYTASHDGSVKKWDMETFQCVLAFTGHAGHVLGLATAGAYLISASHDRTLRVWDMDEGTCDGILSGHAEAVVCVAAQGQYVYSGSHDRTLKIWDLETFQCVETLVGHEDYVRSVAVDNRWIYSGADDLTIKVWDINTAVCTYTLVGHQGGVRCLVPAGARLFSGGDDARIKVWDMHTLLNTHTLKGHDLSITRLLYKDGRLFSGSRDRHVKIWDDALLIDDELSVSEVDPNEDA